MKKKRTTQILDENCGRFCREKKHAQSCRIVIDNFNPAGFQPRLPWQHSSLAYAFCIDCLSFSLSSTNAAVMVFLEKSGDFKKDTFPERTAGSVGITEESSEGRMKGQE